MPLVCAARLQSLPQRWPTATLLAAAHAPSHARAPAPAKLPRAHHVPTPSTPSLAAPSAARPFSSSRAQRAQNIVHSPVRNADSFQTYLALASSARTPLLTLWTASWCPTCRTVEPLIRSLVEAGVGQDLGGVAFAPVEFDAPDFAADPLANPATTYMITSIPTLLSFDAGEAQLATKVTDARKLADREFLADWIRTEASRHGGRGGGGGAGGGGSIFSGLFGSGR